MFWFHFLPLIEITVIMRSHLSGRIDGSCVERRAGPGKGGTSYKEVGEGTGKEGTSYKEAGEGLGKEGTSYKEAS